MSTDVLGQPANYGLELVDALTQGPLQCSSAVVETLSGTIPFLVNQSRWVFAGLGGSKMPTTANFVITAPLYVAQTLPTGVALSNGLFLPNPSDSEPGFLATIPMLPRTGYPFPTTLTRLIGLVRLDSTVNLATPAVPNATVTLTAIHNNATPPPPTASDTITVTTTDDGQYTWWFLPQLLDSPTIANQVSVSVVDSQGHSGSTPAPVSLTPNGVTYAPTIYIK